MVTLRHVFRFIDHERPGRSDDYGTWNINGTSASMSGLYENTLLFSSLETATESAADPTFKKSPLPMLPRLHSSIPAGDCYIVSFFLA